MISIIQKKHHFKRHEDFNSGGENRRFTRGLDRTQTRPASAQGLIHKVAGVSESS